MLSGSDLAETQNKMTTELSSTLHGLFKYTNYSVQVLAFTRVGDGNASSPVHCRTREDGGCRVQHGVSGLSAHQSGKSGKIIVMRKS